MGVGGVLRAHLRDCVGEQAFTDENIRVFRKKAEDQPRHEVVHVMATGRRAPFVIVLQKFNVQPVEAARGANIERILADLADGGNARQWEEKPEMIREILIGARNGFAAGQIFGFKGGAVGGENKFCFRLCRRGAVFESLERFCYIAGAARQDVDIVGLEDSAKVGLVRRACAQALNRRLLVAESFKKGVWESCRVERLFGEFCYCLFYLDRVQLCSLFDLSD